MCVALSNIHTGYRTTIVETVKWIPNNEMLFADSYGTTTLGGMENKSFENEKLEGNKEESAVMAEEAIAAKMPFSEEQGGEVIEISSDDEETEDMMKPKKTAATEENLSTKALAEALEKQISSMSVELECPVCLNECSPPIFTCLAQHPVCAECREGLELCAVCREPYNQGMIRHRYVVLVVLSFYNYINPFKHLF